MEKPDSFEIKKIEKYLKGELKEKERTDFEEEIKQDPALAEKVEQVKQLPGDLFVMEKNRLAQQVKGWIESEKQDNVRNLEAKKTGTSFTRRIISIAAILGFLIMATGVWFSYSSNDLNTKVQQYAAEYHQKPIVLRGSADDSWELAIENYTNQEFDQMIQQMKPWIDGQNTTVEQTFYFGLANIYSKNANVDEALDYFSRTRQKDPTTYNEEIAWYRALIYIQREEYEKARGELKKIESSNRYGKGALELLGEME